MPANKAGIAGKAAALIRPVVEGLGLSLWDVEFKKEGVSWYLRVFIDKDGGVALDDCENVSRALNKPLDEADFLDKSYYLEVSSPGIERVLKRPEHYESCIGSTLRIKLFSPRGGRKDFEGILRGFCAGELILEENGTRLSFSPEEIAFARTTYDFT